MHHAIGHDLIQPAQRRGYRWRLQRLLQCLQRQPDPLDRPLLQAIAAGLGMHWGNPPLHNGRPFSPAERTLADIFATVALQLELSTAPSFSRLYNPLDAEYRMLLDLGHGYVLEGSYGNILVQNAYPDRGCLVLHCLTMCGRHQSDIVLRTATFQCWQSDAALARTTVNVLHPALDTLRSV